MNQTRVSRRQQPFPTIIHGASLMTEQDIYLFKEGSHFRLYEKLGSHVRTVEGIQGTHFAVWAPNAEKVSVIGDFNSWKAGAHPLSVRWDASGIWEGFIPSVGQGSLYKYHIVSKRNHLHLEKGDPFAFHWETPPKTASVVWDLTYQHNGGKWNEDRYRLNALDS